MNRVMTPSATLMRTAPRVARARVAVVYAHGAPSTSTTTEKKAGHGHGSMKMGPSANKGFVMEMRKVAMKLHTKEQAPKEGERKPPPKMPKWNPTKEGYLQFLVESKAVYDCLETIMKEGDNEAYAKFQDTGLERSARLAADIQLFKDEYDLDTPEVKADGPGAEYVSLLQKLAVESPQAFICHYYNQYFAHTAGGMMIGKKVAGEVLDSRTLSFYEFDREVQDILEEVRASINEVAEEWTDEQKELCLEETENSFKYSGALMRSIFADE